MNNRLKVLIAASEDTSDKPGAFQVKHSGEFVARKFIPHITDFKDDKSLCGKECSGFRKNYSLDYSKDIVGVIYFPSVLPELIDDPQMYIKNDIPKHDVLIAIGIHTDILIELIKKVVVTGCKAIITPRENPFWIDTASIGRIKKLCEKKGLEYAFPRPFCSLTKGKTLIINKFIDQFRIGKPNYQVFFDENKIVKNIDVKCSSPCGATYFVASGLLGLKSNRVVESANKLWHSYPCLSSSQMDPEIKDSPLHMAAYINLYAAKDAVKHV